MATILHLTTVHPRTDVRIVGKEANTLASHLPHKVTLMVADGKGSVDDEFGGVSVHDLGCPRGGRLGRMLVGPWRAFRTISRVKPAVVHFHDPELIPLGTLLKGMGYTVIYDVHEDVPQQTISKHWIPKIMRYPVMIAISALERASARSLDAVIPATPKIAERFPADKTVVVQNFPICTELARLNSTPYGQRSPRFAYIGGIAEIRGAVEMILALEQLKDIDGIRLDLAGEYSPSNFEGALRALPGWVAVRYHGHVSRAGVAGILGEVRAGLVVLHPTGNYVDSYPVKMFEYMSSSLPVIASDFPLWRQIIDGAGCGLLVDPMNPKAIADAMRWILEHPEEAETMGNRGRLAVERMYNWDAEAVKMIRLYEKLLSKDNKANKT